MNLFRKTFGKIGKTLGLRNPQGPDSLLLKVVLKAEGTLAIQPRRDSAQEVACRRGVLWITQEGDRQDIILKQGQRVTLKGRGKILIQAFTSSTFLMSGVQQTA